MERLLNEVNEEVYTLSCKEEQYSGMGTTFVAATVVDGIAYIMNIGDSRLYYFDEKIHQVTMDHSLVEELVRQENLTGRKPESSTKEYYYKGRGRGRRCPAGFLYRRYEGE